MEKEPSLSPPPSRIPFSPLQLATVALTAIFNSVIFGILSRQLQDLANWLLPLYFLCLFFGVLFAAGCNLTAGSIALRLRRKEVADRILLFLVINMSGLTLL